MSSAPLSTDPSPSPTSDLVASSHKHAWSHIVAAPITKKLTHSEQIPTIAKEPETNQVRGLMQNIAELAIAPAESTLDDGGVSGADARVFDEASGKGEEAVEASKTVVPKATIVVAADGTDVSQNKPPESSLGDVAEPRVSKPPWRKPPIVAEGEIKPQPVMGATAWPALAEARYMKSSDTRRSKSSSPKTPHSGTSIQEPLSKVPLHTGDGSNYQQGVKPKPFIKGGAVGNGRPAFQPIENGASSLEHPALGAHGGSQQPIKHNTHSRMKGNFSANPPMDNVHHHRNDGGGPFPNNNRKLRNNHRDQGRGNYGWHHHNRAYENNGDMVTLLHEQRIGPRNMPRAQPYMNMNPAFYPIPQFQNGGMYYIPPGAPEYLHGPPYFPPMAPPGGVMHGPDPTAIRSMLLQQIDYYFSVENLCKDVFLRTQMDEEGYVPVSVIARFNRIQRLSPNPMVILEALQLSAVVEIQHDRIRRRNDKGKWRLLRAQVYPGQEETSLRNLSEGGKKKPERAGDGASVSSSEEARIGVAKVSDMPLEDAGSRFDRINGNGNCVGLEDRDGDEGDDDIDPAKAHHNSTLGTDSSTESSLSRDGSSTEEHAVNSSSISDSAANQSSNSCSLQGGTECTERGSAASQHETCSSDCRLSVEIDMASQAAVDGKPVCWEQPKGFWTKNDAYFMHGEFKEDDTEAANADFMLKAHEGGDEHHGEANGRDMQRLMSVSHTPLGSFIAVP